MWWDGGFWKIFCVVEDCRLWEIFMFGLLTMKFFRAYEVLSCAWTLFTRMRVLVRELSIWLLSGAEIVFVR
jgi:hypothetical protein